MKDQKFIIVQDEATAKKFIAYGFQVVSHINGIYTFLNQIPEHFNFDENDIKKVVFTNRLTF